VAASATQVRRAAARRAETTAGLTSTWSREGVCVLEEVEEAQHDLG
jgi:hypothetical protein